VAEAGIYVLAITKVQYPALVGPFISKAGALAFVIEEIKWVSWLLLLKEDS
jgi:hypothetical protein